MSEERTPKELATNLLLGMAYFTDLSSLYESLPHDEISLFCERHDAPIGASRIDFLLRKAIELERTSQEAYKRGYDAGRVEGVLRGRDEMQVYGTP